MANDTTNTDGQRSSMFKGQLKISLSADNNSLQVHVVEAANLRSRWKDLCDPYIQLQVCPDEDCNNRYQTTTLLNTNSPYYDTTFNLSLSGVTKQQRLIISAWHRDMQKNCGEFLGCMSFGMKHLVHKVKRKKVDGWYHLLSENVGHRKHLSVDPQSEPNTPNKQHDLEQTVLRRETFTLVIHRQNSGYGFTVRGSCPVKVGRVKEGGPAHQIGLRRGDHIIKINGQNVCRSSAESVASIVRHAEQMVVMDLYRSKKSHRVDSSCASSRASSIPSLDLNHAILEHQDENMPPSASMLNVSRSVIGASCKDIVYEQKMEKHCEAILQSPCKWDPEISVIGSIASGNSVPQLRNYISVPSLSEIEEDSHHVSMTTDASNFFNDQLPESLLNNDDSYLVSDSDASFIYEHSLIPENHLPSQPNCSMATESDFVTHCSLDGVRREVLSGGSSAECSVQSNTTTAVHHPPSVLTLLRLEKDFSKYIQLAVQNYSRPLRHCLVSTKQHQRLFQNVEKMAAIAGFIAKQLEQESVASVYISRVSMLCESYETYLSGLRESRALLKELQDDPEFHQFLTLTAQSCNIELEDVILRPVQHLKSLVLHLQEILIDLQSDSTETAHLSSVIFKLQSTLISSKRSRSHSKIKDSKRYISQHLDISELSSMLRAGSPASTMLPDSEDDEVDQTHAESVSVSVANSSINSEVLELQSRLSIPRNIKRFKLANSHRHLIYSGHLMRVQDSCPQRLLVLLLSDLLLVTRENEDGHLTVVEEPLLLERMHIEWEKQNACEFTVTSQGRHSKKQITLHAESSQQKNAWRSIIEHRMSVSMHSGNTSKILDIL